MGPYSRKQYLFRIEQNVFLDKSKIYWMKIRFFEYQQQNVTHLIRYSGTKIGYTFHIFAEKLNVDLAIMQPFSLFSNALEKRKHTLLKVEINKRLIKLMDS